MGHGYYKDFAFGPALDDIIHAARDFGERMREMGPKAGCAFEECRDKAHHGWNEHVAPYFYPPANIYTVSDGSLVLEFSLAGIDQSSVAIAFQGDYLTLSAKAALGGEDESERFVRWGFKPRDINRQKYRVSAADYAQDQAKAVFKNGILTVTVPPKEPEGPSIKVEIVKEGN
jgi:HSP20 family molecular chaperone IbpA